jgi:hypothetical protein
MLEKGSNAVNRYWFRDSAQIPRRQKKASGRCVRAINCMNGNCSIRQKLCDGWRRFERLGVWRMGSLRGEDLVEKSLAWEETSFSVFHGKFGIEWSRFGQSSCRSNPCRSNSFLVKPIASQISGRWFPLVVKSLVGQKPSWSNRLLDKPQYWSNLWQATPLAGLTSVGQISYQSIVGQIPYQSIVGQITCWPNPSSVKPHVPSNFLLVKPLVCQIPMSIKPSSFKLLSVNRPLKPSSSLFRPASCLQAQLMHSQSLTPPSNVVHSSCSRDFQSFRSNLNVTSMCICFSDV